MLQCRNCLLIWNVLESWLIRRHLQFYIKSRVGSLANRSGKRERKRQSHRMLLFPFWPTIVTLNRTEHSNIFHLQNGNIELKYVALRIDKFPLKPYIQNNFIYITLLLEDPSRRTKTDKRRNKQTPKKL